MKNIIALIMSLSLSLSAQVTMTYTTNYPSTTLSVTAQSTLLKDGQPLTLYFSGRDFTVTNNVIYLVTPANGFTGIVTNWGSGVNTSNRIYFSNGICTNVSYP